MTNRPAPNCEKSPRLSAVKKTLAATVALSALLLTGCDLAADPSPSPSASASMSTGIELPAKPPATFLDRAAWKTSFSKEARPAIGPAGVVAVAESGKALTLLNKDTGKAIWTTTDFPKVPTFSWVSINGRDWVVTTVKDGDKTTISSFDAAASGEALKPAATATGTWQPVVAPNGVMLISPDSAATWWPATGELTQLTALPARGEEKALPIAPVSGGFILAYPTGGFLFSGDGQRWEPETVGPDPKKGKVLAVGTAYLIAEWDSKIALHSLRDGKVVATVPVGGIPANPLPIIRDNRWAVWGKYVFPLDGASKDGKVLDQGTPMAVYQDVLYAAGSTGQYTATDIPSGDLMGEPSAVGLVGLAGANGIFAFADGDGATLFGVPLR